MTIKEQNAVREQYLAQVMRLFEGEDIGLIASNKFNLPIVYNEEEAWLEITVSLTKDKDIDSGYMKREEYTLKQKKAAERAEKAAKKKEKDKAAKAKEEKEE